MCRSSRASFSALIKIELLRSNCFYYLITIFHEEGIPKGCLTVYEDD
jgi:hypothetical protein